MLSNKDGLAFFGPLPIFDEGTAKKHPPQKTNIKKQSLLLRAKLEKRAKQMKLKKRKFTTSSLGHQDKKAVQSSPPKPLILDEKYQKSIRCRIERVKFVTSLTFPQFLEAGTLYLEINHTQQCIFANAAGFRPETEMIVIFDKKNRWQCIFANAEEFKLKPETEMIVVLKKENSWQWVIFEYEKLIDVLSAPNQEYHSDTISTPEVVDQIVKICGCIQGEKRAGPWEDDSQVLMAPERPDGPLPAGLANVIKNFARLIAKRINERHKDIADTLDGEQAQLEPALFYALDVIAKYSRGNFTNRDFIVMYYYLNRYIDTISKKLAAADLGVLLVSSLIYADRIIEDSPAPFKEVAKLYKVELAKLRQSYKEFCMALQGAIKGSWLALGPEQEAEFVLEPGPARQSVSVKLISPSEYQATKAMLETPDEKSCDRALMPPPPPKKPTRSSSRSSSQLSKASIFSEKALPPDTTAGKGPLVTDDQEKNTQLAAKTTAPTAIVFHAR